MPETPEGSADTPVKEMTLDALFKATERDVSDLRGEFAVPPAPPTPSAWVGVLKASEPAAPAAQETPAVPEPPAATATESEGGES